jgi:membrane-associated phospholipid phosphatase
MAARFASARASAGAALLVAALVFLPLAHEAAEPHPLGWDTVVVAAVARMENGAFEAVMVLFSFLGAGVGLMLLLSPTLLALMRRQRVADVAFVTLSLLVAQVVGRVAKDAIDKPRPPIPDHEELRALFDLRQAVVLLVGAAVIAALATPWRRHALALGVVLVLCVLLYEVLAPRAYASESRSFPSGHATSSMAFTAAAVVLAWPTRWRWRALGAGAAFVALVGLSRIAVGVHYPSDILGGWCVALASVALMGLVVRPGRTANALATAGTRARGASRARPRSAR